MNNQYQNIEEVLTQKQKDNSKLEDWINQTSLYCKVLIENNQKNSNQIINIKDIHKKYYEHTKTLNSKLICDIEQFKRIVEQKIRMVQIDQRPININELFCLMTENKDQTNPNFYNKNINVSQIPSFSRETRPKNVKHDDTLSINDDFQMFYKTLISQKNFTEENNEILKEQKKGYLLPPKKKKYFRVNSSTMLNNDKKILINFNEKRKGGQSKTKNSNEISDQSNEGMQRFFSRNSFRLTPTSKSQIKNRRISFTDNKQNNSINSDNKIKQLLKQNSLNQQKVDQMIPRFQIPQDQNKSSLSNKSLHKKNQKSASDLNLPSKIESRKLSHMFTVRNNKTQLIFSNFKIKKSYVHFIKKELQKCENLKQLYLDGNQFGDEGLQIICNSLVYSSIQMIDLRNNQLSSKSLEILKNLVLKNKSLKLIKFQNNSIDNNNQQWLNEFNKLKVTLEL